MSSESSSATEWVKAWAVLGVTPPPAGLLPDLLAAYSEPYRAYHNLRHLDECFERLGPVRPLLHRPAEVTLALWFHDAVYDPQRPDNEWQSAEWASRAIRAAGLLDDAAPILHQLILATKHDAPPTTDDARYLVDADLAILGADQARFDEYEAQVRQEYAWVGDPSFRLGRSRILNHFLARPSIFATDEFRARFEVPAGESGAVAPAVGFLT